MNLMTHKESSDKISACQGESSFVYVEVALNVAHNNGLFCYKLTTSLENPVGYRVLVSLKTRTLLGVITKILPQDFRPNYAVKEIEQVIDPHPSITKKQQELLSFCSNYYFNPLGMVYQLALIKNTVSAKIKESTSNFFPKVHFDLNPEQKKAVETILNNDKKNFLLEGVTGSGKTLVYLEVAKKLLQKGHSILFLVPEISLTSHLVERVESFLQTKAAVLHSGVSPAKKRDEYLQLLNSEKKVLIGARSAIFAPLQNIGLIVVDEEHDQSFKQDESPRYNARDLALWRSKNENCLCILGSATPSLESLYNVELNKLVKVKLPFRHNLESKLPNVEIIDLKERKSDIDFYTQDKCKTKGQKICILSRPLINKMNEVLESGKQVLLFLNQRGYAKFGLCNDCGKIICCPNCSVSLTYYEKKNILMCHQCDHVEKAENTCKECSARAVVYLGLGTERLEEETKRNFENYKILRLDREVVSTSKQLEEIINQMYEKKADILIGTQMIAKGHDFGHLGLVGVICADTALAMPDFRAAEKSFSLLTQVVGRCGRRDEIGHAMIQTFNPEHPSIQFTKLHDSEGFYKQELSLREQYGFPPFVKASIIRVEHKDKLLAKELIEACAELINKKNSTSVLLGPSECSIGKINGRFRYQCLILCKTQTLMHEILKTIYGNKEINEKVLKIRARLIIDRDAYST